MGFKWPESDRPSNLQVQLYLQVNSQFVFFLSKIFIYKKMLPEGVLDRIQQLLMRFLAFKEAPPLHSCIIWMRLQPWTLRTRLVAAQEYTEPQRALWKPNLSAQVGMSSQAKCLWETWKGAVISTLNGSWRSVHVVRLDWWDGCSTGAVCSFSTDGSSDYCRQKTEAVKSKFKRSGSILQAQCFQSLSCESQVKNWFVWTRSHGRVAETILFEFATNTSPNFPVNKSCIKVPPHVFK